MSDAEVTKLREEDQRPSAIDFDALAFSGARLESVRDREEPQSPLAGLLDPEPGLHVVAGSSAIGKTTMALHIGISWACGVEPWSGAAKLPGSRVLMISREQRVSRIDRRARAVDTMHPTASRDLWTRRMAFVARDVALPNELRPLLRLDQHGLPLLRAWLEKARQEGDPFGLVILDSLSRLKPASLSTLDNDDMSSWLDELHGLSEELEAYLLLLHHKGHNEREGDRGAGRGATAIDDVAQGVWDLRRIPGLRAYREIRVYGNGLEDETFTFRVAPDLDPGKVLFWRLEKPEDSTPPTDFLTPGMELSTQDLAWRLSGKVRPAPGPGGKAPRPSREARERAQRLRDNWEAAGLVTVRDGPHNAKMISMAKPEDDREEDIL